jgi:hypothetical protein
MENGLPMGEDRGMSPYRSSGAKMRTALPITSMSRSIGAGTSTTRRVGGRICDGRGSDVVGTNDEPEPGSASAEPTVDREQPAVQ